MATELNAQRLHRYLGIPLCVLLLLASISGILLNHRSLLLSLDAPSWLVPSSYTYTNWNNGALRGSLTVDSLRYYFGGAGIYVQAKDGNTPMQDDTNGIREGGDEKRIIAMCQDNLGRLWAASQFRLYRKQGTLWQEQTLPKESGERITDLVAHSNQVYALSRSFVYRYQTSQPNKWERVELAKPDDYTGRLSLFRLMWALHSGEYFGKAGILFVDFIAVVVIILCITGLLYNQLRLLLRSTRLKSLLSKENKQLASRGLVSQYKWHDKLGRMLFIPTLFVLLSGAFLRPPLMIPLAITELKPWKISHLYSDNPWHESLRAMRYSPEQEQWILSTSRGFYTLATFSDKPDRWHVQPPISPMGINVFERLGAGDWLIGSFSGLYRVSTHPSAQHPIIDYTSGKPYNPKERRSPVSDNPIAGLAYAGVNDLPYIVSYTYGTSLLRPAAGRPRDHGQGATIPQPASVQMQRMSLWQYALEVHTGRVFGPLIGEWGVFLFIPLLGITSAVVMITGYKRRGRRNK